MTQPKTMTGGRSLLFERLIDFEPDHPTGDEPSATVLSMPDLKASIRREVARILDSRSTGTRRPDLGGTALDYGISDITHLDAASDADRRQVERMVRQAIIDFEPRLKRPRVTVSAGSGRGTMVTSISGEVVAGTVTERLEFDVGLRGQAPNGPDRTG
ncbi:type VI secretion system baseplate subunit TssE [Azospirillum brasilense]|nr:type VI secretion system baseplate subunit TssE [Azospirillum brasilense]